MREKETCGELRLPLDQWIVALLAGGVTTVTIGRDDASRLILLAYSRGFRDPKVYWVCEDDDGLSIAIERPVVLGLEEDAA